jgi:hypothetical protein
MLLSSALVPQPFAPKEPPLSLTRLPSLTSATSVTLGTHRYGKLDSPTLSSSGFAPWHCCCCGLGLPLEAPLMSEARGDQAVEPLWTSL